jgi:hypothetical protein
MMPAMRTGLRNLVIVACSMAGAAAAPAQELIPAAYTPAPVGVNLVSLAVTSNRGDIAFDPSGPIADGSGDIMVSALSYGRTLGLLGRSSTFTVVLPWVEGDLEGLFLGEQAYAERSGQGDLVVRFGLNLLGGPAMTPAEFASYRPRTLVGLSVTGTAPTGQYDPSKLINIGTNRWSLKTEVGFVQVVGRWAFDGYAGLTVFTSNTDFFGGRTRSQDPIWSTQLHARYLIRRGLWAAADANFWRGGRTTVDGVSGDDLQENSRAGVTVSWQVAPGHNLRFAASRGAFTRIGGDFDSIGLSYAHSWAGRRKAAPAPGIEGGSEGAAVGR